jgi:hypothetical protein
VFLFVSDCVYETGLEVVMVKLGPTWGSGVVINKDCNVILTCSHVIKDSHHYPGVVLQFLAVSSKLRKTKTCTHVCLFSLNSF